MYKGKNACFLKIIKIFLTNMFPRKHEFIESRIIKNSCFRGTVALFLKNEITYLRNSMKTRVSHIIQFILIDIF